jgi:hypothetical protein
MATEPYQQQEPYKSAELVGGASGAEAIGGAGAVVLAILGLAGLFPEHLAAVATLAVAVALTFEGGALTTKCRKLIAETTTKSIGAIEVGGGMTAAFLSGLAGIALGILALLGIASNMLMPIAAIVFGAGLLLSSGTTQRLNSLAAMVEEHTSHAHDTAREVAREAVSAGVGAQVLVGLGAIVLGILALVGMVPLTLTLVAMLSLGGAALFSGSALTGRMLTAIWG